MAVVPSKIICKSKLLLSKKIPKGAMCLSPYQFAHPNLGIDSPGECGVQVAAHLRRSRSFLTRAEAQKGQKPAPVRGFVSLNLLVVTSASLVETSASLVVTRSY